MPWLRLTLSHWQVILPTSMHSMLCYRRWKRIRRSSTTVTTSCEPSLNCGSNEATLNHPRLHWMHKQHAMHPCIQTYPSCCRCSSLCPSPLHCHARAFLFHSQTAKDIRSVAKEWLTSLALIHVHAHTTPIKPLEVVHKFALTQA